MESAFDNARLAYPTVPMPSMAVIHPVTNQETTIPGERLIFRSLQIDLAQQVCAMFQLYPAGHPLRVRELFMQGLAPFAVTAADDALAFASTNDRMMMGLGLQNLLAANTFHPLVDFIRDTGHGDWLVGLQVSVLVAKRHADGTVDVIDKTVVSTRFARPLNASITECQNVLYYLLVDIIIQIFEKDLGQSGFELINVTMVRIDCARITTPVGRGWISTPSPLMAKRCTLNVQNSDNCCAKYAFALGACRALGETLPRNVQFEMDKAKALADRFDWTGIDFPLELSGWDDVEKLNQDFQVFVYRIECSEDKITEVSLCRRPRLRGPERKHVYLLLLEKEISETEVAAHYVTITSIAALFNTSGHRYLTCPYCGCTIRDGHQFQSHVNGCSEVATSLCSLPPPNAVREFENFAFQLQRPVVMFADFECRMEEKDGLKSHVPVSFALHVVNRLQGKTEHQLDCPTKIFQSGDPQLVVQQLLDCAQDYSDKVRQYLAHTQDHEHPNHKRAGVLYRPRNRDVDCVICREKAFGAPAGVITRLESRLCRKKAAVVMDEAASGSDEEDHTSSEPEHSSDEDQAPLDEHVHVPSPLVDFLTGEFRGYAHPVCVRVVRKQEQRTVRGKPPLFFHNGTGYDLKLILRYAGNCTVEGLEKAFCIAQTAERFKRIDICGVSMMDSLSHLNASLDSLVKRVTNDGRNPERCNNMRQGLTKLLSERGLSSDESEAVWPLLTRKGVFPYAWLNCVDRMNETSLPDKGSFKSDLSGKDITDEEYQFAQDVWCKTRCQTFLDYHNIYLLTDVWGLADAMGAYTDFCMTNYGVDPTHYASAPAAANDAMLRLTKAKVELISDIEIYRAFERCIRGGVAMACHPHAVASNKYTRLAEGDASMEERPDDSFIASLDENNMYGGGMCGRLPVGGFAWLTSQEVESFCLPEQLDCDDSPTGYLLEVDLEFPPESHDFLNDLPPAPENIMVEDNWLSDMQQEVIKTKQVTKTKKLIPHLGPRRNYMVYAPTLKLYMEVGTKVTKVHRILRFRQEAVIKPFVMLNTELRKAAAERGDLFGVDQAKAFVNSTYGKQLQDVRKYAQYRIVRTEGGSLSRGKLCKLVSSNRLRRFVPMGSLYVLEFAKKKTLLSSPVFLGAIILERAKRSLYNFWYKIMRPFFPSIRLLYTDTDSLLVYVKTGDIYRDCLRLEKELNGGEAVTVAGQGIFDWSSLDPVVHPEYFSTINSKELGHFKFDDGSTIPGEVIALRSKMYTKTKIFNIKEGKYVKSKCAAKGIPRECATQLDYQACLANGTIGRVSFVRIAGRQFELATRSMSKEGLAPPLFNDKRHLRVVDGVWVSYALGHHATL